MFATDTDIEQLISSEEAQDTLINAENSEASTEKVHADNIVTKSEEIVKEPAIIQETEQLPPVIGNDKDESKPEQEPEKPLRRIKLEAFKSLQSEDGTSSQDSPKVAEPRRRDSRRMPTFIARLKNRSATENSIIKLTCAISEPDCSVRWSKDGVSIKSSEKYLIDSSNGVLSLEIKGAISQDAGDYSCVVANNYGEIETSAVLAIFGEEVQQTISTFTKNLKGE